MQCRRHAWRDSVFLFGGIAENFTKIEPTHSAILKKKEISWSDSKYLDKVRLQDCSTKSQAAILERKTSVGPCFKPETLYGGPSGITLCVPKRSVRAKSEQLNQIQSVININVSKRTMSKSTSYLNQHSRIKMQKKQHEIGIKIEPEERQNCFSKLRTKLDNMTNKIRKLLI